MSENVMCTHIPRVRVEVDHEGMDMSWIECVVCGNRLYVSDEPIEALRTLRLSSVRVDVLLRWMNALLERTRKGSIWGGTTVDFDLMGQQVYHVISARLTRRSLRKENGQ